MQCTVSSTIQTVIDPSLLRTLEPYDLGGRLAFDLLPTRSSAFSDIFKGRYASDNGQLLSVAVKRLRFYTKGLETKHLFEKEVYVWLKLEHENILPLLGFAFCEHTGYPLLVSEWMSQGTLWSFVRNASDIDSLVVVALIHDVAKGIAYLHSRDIVHSDIKSDNAVVNRNGRAMLCDFGTARTLFASRSLAAVSSTVDGTVAYWAPELLDFQMNPKVAKPSDVWAFGMTVYEVVTRKRPFPKQSDFEIVMAVTSGALPEFPDVLDPISARLQEISKRCFIRAPGRRPTMGNILDDDVFGAFPHTRFLVPFRNIYPQGIRTSGTETR